MLIACQPYIPHPESTSRGNRLVPRFESPKPPRHRRPRRRISSCPFIHCWRAAPFGAVRHLGVPRVASGRGASVRKAMSDPQTEHHDRGDLPDTAARTPIRRMRDTGSCRSTDSRSDLTARFEADQYEVGREIGAKVQALWGWGGGRGYQPRRTPKRSAESRELARQLCSCMRLLNLQRCPPIRPLGTRPQVGHAPRPAHRRRSNRRGTSRASPDDPDGDPDPHGASKELAAR
jgi:hypothetical protein